MTLLHSCTYCGVFVDAVHAHLFIECKTQLDLLWLPGLGILLQLMYQLVVLTCAWVYLES